MPSANLVGKLIVNETEFINEPIKYALTSIEHKIRNLEKRKVKLDQYRSEQDQGKELNADQLAAVAKYSEVIQQLDFARDLVKHLTQVHNEARRIIKKAQKREQLEKQAAEMARIEQLFLFQSIVRRMTEDEKIIQDFVDKSPGTVVVTQEDFDALNLLADALNLHEFPPRASDMHSSPYKSPFKEASQHAVWLLDGREKGGFGRKSYKDLKELLLALASSRYFLSRRFIYTYPVEPSKPKAVEAPVVCAPLVEESIPAENVSIQESTYSFLQESQIDIESPHMDPAVVAVSSFIPPPMVSTKPVDVQRSAFTNSGSSGNNRDAVSMGDAISITHTTVIDDEINQWSAPLGTHFAKGDLKPAIADNSDNASHSRGNFRGFRGARYNRGRGITNGFGRGGSPRGYRGRNGDYRNEFPNTDNQDYRVSGRGKRGFSNGNGQSESSPGYYRWE